MEEINKRVVFEDHGMIGDMYAIPNFVCCKNVNTIFHLFKTYFGLHDGKMMASTCITEGWIYVIPNALNKHGIEEICKIIEKENQTKPYILHIEHKSV